MIWLGLYQENYLKTCWHFIARDGEISCKITGQKQRAVLLEGGLEIPCIYTFRGKKKLIDKLKVIINGMNMEAVNTWIVNHHIVMPFMLILHQCQIKVQNCRTALSEFMYGLRPGRLVEDISSAELVLFLFRT